MERASHPLKVMQVITKGESGGAQTHLLALCLALAPRVRFVAAIGGASPRSMLGDELQTLGIPVCAVPQLGNSLSPLRTLAAVRALLCLVREHRPDTLHAHSSVAGVVARIAGRIAGIPVIYTVHGFGFKPEIPRLQRWAAWMAEWTLARLTAHMVCVSSHEMQLARRLPIARGRLSVIPNGVADTPERAQPDHAPARIVMVARLARPKRPDLLLHALALLRARLGHEVPASLIGSGPDMAAHRALARQLKLQAVDFTGDADDVPKRLAQHGVFVLMSDHEGLPISVIEAMRAGLAIVASDLPGMRELIDDGTHGLLVANEAGALAEALLALTAAPALRARLGHAARQRYEARFTPAPMARAVETLYGQIARHEPASDPAR
ncbi:glycosyltransferase [Variovorax sp. SRS16]|uniref:glycosyltransferase n=1 Tax=Variovorax sp. SRS16 TaxID=282217 RepID=UPI001E47227E|nr:glycosyltransferase [Variovorax sp. SRS16]